MRSGSFKSFKYHIINTSIHNEKGAYMGALMIPGSRAHVLPAWNIMINMIFFLSRLQVF